MKSIFLRRKRSHLLKLHLYQIGKAQNMPVVAGRLVLFSTTENLILGGGCLNFAVIKLILSACYESRYGYFKCFFLFWSFLLFIPSRPHLDFDTL